MVDSDLHRVEGTEAVFVAEDIRVFEHPTLGENGDGGDLATPSSD